MGVEGFANRLVSKGHDNDNARLEYRLKVQEKQTSLLRDTETVEFIHIPA